MALQQAIPYLADEETMAWRFYLDAKLSEFCLAYQAGLVIDIFEYATLQDCKKEMETFPLIKAGLMEVT
ncbi:MAG: hypothetical protein H7Z13_05375 [Ferruginibacter sp.]|nr:hypothetical protein [Ferruginibacter sp.]